MNAFIIEVIVRGGQTPETPYGAGSEIESLLERDGRCIVDAKRRQKYNSMLRSVDMAFEKHDMISMTLRAVSRPDG